MFSKINIRNSENVELEGYYFDAQSNTCALHIPGFGGAFESLPEIIGNFCQRQGIAYLCGLTQGAYPSHEYKKYNQDGSFSIKLGGAMYENFDDSKDDIDAWVKFLLSQGYENIFLVGHSLGCNKVLYYAKENNLQCIKGIILLAPQDFSKIALNPIHTGMLEEAELNINAGEPLKILTGKFLGFAPISSKTFYNIANNKNQHNFNYKDKTDDFETLLIINKPIYSLIGSRDPAFDDFVEEEITALFENIVQKYEKFTYCIIPDGNHTFKSFEDIVANNVCQFIKRLNDE